MEIQQLRNHIPIAAPARREPADGTEPALRVSLGFEPAWFHRRCDVSFSERWHTDPVYRHDTLSRMKRELRRRFPGVEHWQQDGPCDLPKLSGCYGAYFVPAVAGIPLRFAPDRWPLIEPGHELSVSDVERLDVESLLQSPVVEDLFRQMDTLERRWGAIGGYVNWQGVLNNAFHLRGQEIFMDMVDRPELAHRLFTSIGELIIRLARKVQERQRRSGFYIDQMSVSNCTVNMISPRMYEQFILPRDTEIAVSFERFGVHTCNWNVTPYLTVLQKLPKVGYLDMGTDSDFQQARCLFPEARRAVLCNPGWLTTASDQEIAKELRRIYQGLAPCDVVMADLPWDIQDESVNRVFELAKTIAAADPNLGTR